MSIHIVATVMRAPKTETKIRQEQLAQAALNVAARHGLCGLNVARVAKAVGVVPSALYRHYSGKKQVLDAVFDLIADRLQANVRAARENGTTALERLHRLLVQHVNLIQQNKGIMHVVFSEELLHGPAAHRRRMYEVIRAYLREVEALIRDGQREGGIRSDVEPEAASLLFLGLIQPSVVLWGMSGGKFNLHTHAEAGWKLFVEAVG